MDCTPHHKGEDCECSGCVELATKLAEARADPRPAPAEEYGSVDDARKAAEILKGVPMTGVVVLQTEPRADPRPAPTFEEAADEAFTVHADSMRALAEPPAPRCTCDAMQRDLIASRDYPHDAACPAAAKRGGQ